MRFNRIAICAVLLVLVGCTEASELSSQLPSTTSSPRSTTTASTMAEDPSRAPSTTTAAPTSAPELEIQRTSPNPVTEPCRLADTRALVGAGYRLDEEPRSDIFDVDKDPDIRGRLEPAGLTGIATCDLSFDVVLIVWVGVDNAAAEASLSETIASALNGGSAEEQAVEGNSTTGVSLVDPEFETSTVQWTNERFHVVINVLNYRIAGLTAGEVRSLHRDLMAYADARLPV